jgi:hypothetical protein
MILHFPVEIKASRVEAMKSELAKLEQRLALITIALASATGLLALYYTGKPFGSGADYLVAALWGFGLDQSVKGYAATKTRLGW